MSPEKLVVILGPTASGKSSLGINLAKKFNGEIISADSRQVYKGMDIGTGKVSKAEQKIVKHHLLDVASPKKQFTVTDFKKLAYKSIIDMRKRGKLPFIVGGAAFYIYALIDNLDLPEAKPNFKLRKALEKKSTKELFIILKNLDPKRAKTIDKNNPVRLIRAIEINVVTGKSVPQMTTSASIHKPNSNILILGITKHPDELKKLINKRVDLRLKAGMVKEVKKLKSAGLSFKKLEAFGLEYRFISHYLQGKTNYDGMVDQLKAAIYQFSRRQMTWFNRDPRIKWIKDNKQAEILVRKFVNK